VTKDSTPTEKARGGYHGKIPTAAYIALERELVGLEHGTASLTIHVRDGRLARFVAGRERSFIGDDSGE
jgi:hypothetical protein